MKHVDIWIQAEPDPVTEDPEDKRIKKEAKDLCWLIRWFAFWVIVLLACGVPFF